MDISQKGELGSPNLRTLVKIKLVNLASFPTKLLQATYGESSGGVVSFEHINIGGINPHSDFVELTHTLGTLEASGTGIYSINETKWDTMCPSFCKYIKSTIKRRDGYSKFVFLPIKRQSLRVNGSPEYSLRGIMGMD